VGCSRRRLVKETTIMIQYVDTGNKRNSKVNGTSIFIEDKELAKEIFGFEPKFINYELMNNSNDFKHYTEYNPKVYKSYSIEFNIN
jgi:hypothetical protein